MSTFGMGQTQSSHTGLGTAHIWLCKCPQGHRTIPSPSPVAPEHSWIKVSVPRGAPLVRRFRRPVRRAHVARCNLRQMRKDLGYPGLQGQQHAKMVRTRLKPNDSCAAARGRWSVQTFELQHVVNVVVCGGHKCGSQCVHVSTLLLRPPQRKGRSSILQSESLGPCPNRCPPLARH